jgi:EAL domain-containing protein (putative c-di-GMP-specific phosphodiesterase class I)/ActR/RegA family two-component response regulator
LLAQRQGRGEAAMIVQSEASDALTGAAPGSAREPRRTTAFCLIVDDEKSIRTLIAKSLRQFMVMTEECGDAASALVAIKHRTPDLIFLDVSLERSDAVEVIRGLGEMQFAGNIQLMSGRDLPLLEDIKRVGERYALKMLPVLQKPFRIDAIMEILHQVGLGRASGPGLKASLFSALCAGWLELYYQPILDLRTMQLSGAEGLARVNHPEHGLLTPGDVLPGADPASLLALGEFAINAALRDWCEFDESGAPLRLSVNIPMHALTKLPIAAIVRENRPRSSRWPGIILEVREDQIVRDIPLAYEIATQLSIYNIFLAIDGFGYAASALAQLTEFPNVEFKLDRNFVAGCAADDAKKQLCQSLIELARRRDRRIIAVGLDQLQDVQALTRMGCDFGQGMLLGPPLPTIKIRQMIKIRTGLKPGG